MADDIIHQLAGPELPAKDVEFLTLSQVPFKDWPLVISPRKRRPSTPPAPSSTRGVAGSITTRADLPGAASAPRRLLIAGSTPHSLAGKLASSLEAGVLGEDEQLSQLPLRAWPKVQPASGPQAGPEAAAAVGRSADERSRQPGEARSASGGKQARAEAIEQQPQGPECVRQEPLQRHDELSDHAAEELSQIPLQARLQHRSRSVSVSPAVPLSQLPLQQRARQQVRSTPAAQAGTTRGSAGQPSRKRANSPLECSLSQLPLRKRQEQSQAYEAVQKQPPGSPEEHAWSQLPLSARLRRQQTATHSEQANNSTDDRSREADAAAVLGLQPEGGQEPGGSLHSPNAGPGTLSQLPLRARWQARTVAGSAAVSAACSSAQPALRPAAGKPGCPAADGNAEFALDIDLGAPPAEEPLSSSPGPDRHSEPRRLHRADSDPSRLAADGAGAWRSCPPRRSAPGAGLSEVQAAEARGSRVGNQAEPKSGQLATAAVDPQAGQRAAARPAVAWHTSFITEVQAAGKPSGPASSQLGEPRDSCLRIS